ncbi:hypothetical protein QE390_004372 [Siphonobacter sp. SORGH_AS 1065]|nr:hypothetical protein [Siphonobacter sp. SORGH_AS_1065]
MVGVIILFAVLRLEIRINEDGIAYRWLPFMITYRQMHWDEIESMGVRKYAPLSEFGGWGIRWSLQGTAHTVSGYDGLEIWVKNKKRFILLGTQHPEELTELIKVNQSKITA